MQLFERIKLVAKMNGSVKKLASDLKIPQTTISGYLNEKRQDNLWPLLPQILTLYPTLSRNWLYFGEGPMLVPTPPATAIYESSPTPADGNKICHQQQGGDMTLKLLEAQNELLEAKDTIISLKDELLAAKDKIIALQEENKRHGESGHPDTFTELRRDNPRSVTKGKPAHTAS